MLGRGGNGDAGGKSRAGSRGAIDKTERSPGEEQKPLSSTPESDGVERQMTAASWLKGILSSPPVFAAPISTSSLFMPLARGSGGGGAEAESSGGGSGPQLIAAGDTRCGEGDDNGATESLGARQGSVGRGAEGDGTDMQEACLDDVRYSRAPPSPRHVRGPSPPPSTPAGGMSISVIPPMSAIW